MTLIRMMASCIALAALTGCSTYRAYQGDALDDHQIARLEVPQEQYILDGMELPRADYTHIELLPGHHVLSWDFEYPNRYIERKRIGFDVSAGHTYKLGQKFFPPANPFGLIGEAVGAAFNVASTPIQILASEPPADEAPEGRYYVWIVDPQSRRVVAGLAPDLPMAHSPIAFVPIIGK